MFNKILVVCVGNICRSITAERMLRKAYPQKIIDSAGLGALVNHPADENASAVALKNGLSLSDHRARQITSSMCREYDLILVMEKKHLEGIMKISPEATGKTMLIGKWLENKEIPDPYRKSNEVFEITFDLLKDTVKAWEKYLR